MLCACQNSFETDWAIAAVSAAISNESEIAAANANFFNSKDIAGDRRAVARKVIALDLVCR